MKHIRMMLAVLAVFLSLGSLALPSIANAATGTPKADVCTALGSGSDCKTQSKNGIDLDHVITVLINIFSAVVGVVAVIMIMVSGFKYVTSGGDSNSVSSAKNTLLYAIVGLVVVAMAQIIVKFVLNRVTK